MCIRLTDWFFWCRLTRTFNRVRHPWALLHRKMVLTVIMTVLTNMLQRFLCPTFSFKSFKNQENTLKIERYKIWVVDRKYCCYFSGSSSQTSQQLIQEKLEYSQILTIVKRIIWYLKTGIKAVNLCGETRRRRGLFGDQMVEM